MRIWEGGHWGRWAGRLGEGWGIREGRRWTEVVGKPAILRGVAIGCRNGESGALSGGLAGRTRGIELYPYRRIKDGRGSARVGRVLRASGENAHATGNASSEQRFGNRVPGEMPRCRCLLRSLLAGRPIAHAF